MNDEIVFRILLVVLIVVTGAISGFFRRRASNRSETPPRRADGAATAAGLALAGSALFLSTLLWIVAPQWWDWSRWSAPVWTRWAGVALAVLMLPAFVWMFRHLGDNITPTAELRPEHELVVTGPYRWIRHPLYTFGTIYWLAVSLIVSSWWIAGLMFVLFPLLARRTKREEEALEERFGASYREYRERTGKYVPRFSSSSS